MGREASVERDRICWECHREWFMTARELNEHVSQCKRLKAIGLEAPANVRAVQPVGGLILP